jgi:protein-tyrosine phosphatase
MAAATLARRMAAARVRGQLLSAGTSVGEVSPATADAITAARELWFDLAGHESTPLDATTIVNADLVIGMTRAHAREIVVIEPAAIWRTFTLKEVVRRGEATPRTTEPLSDWLCRLASQRGPEDLLGSSPDDDIADPIGQPLLVYRRTLTELDDLSERLVRAAWPRTD